jgi:hypothetical protein
MQGDQKDEMKNAVYEYASFLYDLYIDSLGDDIIVSGQNNANQTQNS